MAATAQYEISCHCGGVRQHVSSVGKATGQEIGLLTLCHCWSCRHSSGVLCTSYIQVIEPLILGSTTAYTSSNTTTRYFCSTCGCHCFLRRTEANQKEIWSVATGTISGEVSQNITSHGPKLHLKHRHVDSTVDDGLARWLAMDESLTAKHISPRNSEAASRHLSARCHCNNVSFQISQPDSSSQMPTSYFPDLMIPYKDKSDLIENSEDSKWWLREGQRYLAGTCACRSCRLISGFEIQTWAFVPRSNISVNGKPLGFPVKGMLSSYASSSAVTREFCPVCGATVFWHDTLRPDLIDVSVGLLEADGALAEDWLDWWKERVSFAEDAQLGRRGSIAHMAETLIQRLQTGLSDDIAAEKE